MNDTLSRVAKGLAKLAEIAHWIGAVGMLVGLVLLLVMGQGAVIGDAGEPGTEAKVYGFELAVVDETGQPDLDAMAVLMVAGVILMTLMALTFRNVHLILKNSENTTPFQPGNVRMVREIGWFLMALPVVGLIMSVVARLAVGVEAEADVTMGSFVVGLVVLCLSQVFARGLALESDVDGLL